MRNALANRSARLPLSAVWLEAPVQRPGKLITIGVNYKEHAAEAGRDTLPHPPLNFCLVTCINAPYGDMWLPSKSEQFDYELEFTAVIGRRYRGITRAQAPLVVGGYSHPGRWGSLAEEDCHESSTRTQGRRAGRPGLRRCSQSESGIRSGGYQGRGHRPELRRG